MFVPTEPPEPPRFTADLVDRSAVDGDEVVLSCFVTGKPQPSVSWFHNNKCIDRSEDFVLNYDRKTGKTDCVIVECLPDDEGTFKCVARNSSGTAVTSGKLTIRKPGEAVVIPIEIKREPVQKPRGPPVRDEEPMVIDVSAAPAMMGKPVDEAFIVPKSRDEVDMQRQTKITRKQELDITGQNILHGETVTHKEVKVIKKVVKKESGEPPRFSKPIQPQVVKEGQDCVFEATVTGAPTPSVDWLKDKKDLQPDNRTIMVFNPATMTCSLTIRNTTQDDVGVYSCRASNTAGRATCTANTVVVRKYSPSTVTQLG